MEKGTQSKKPGHPPDLGTLEQLEIRSLFHYRRIRDVFIKLLNSKKKKGVFDKIVYSVLFDM